MEVPIKKLTLAAGLSLGLLALPVAHGEGENDGMTVLMNGNFVTADPENIKWVPNKSVPYGMSMVLLYGNPSQPGPYIFRAKMPSGYKLPPHKHPDERMARSTSPRRACRTMRGPVPKSSSRRWEPVRSRNRSSTSTPTTIRERSKRRDW